MLVRDGDDGAEVFMLRRTLDAAFAGGMYVFPGGRVDDADHAEDLEPICDGLDDERASAVLGLRHGGLAYWVAAVRECFEEAGVLLARPVDRREPVRFDEPAVAERFEAARHRCTPARCRSPRSARPRASC
jgi:8-oxo-dGTP pyrophosphatase MutT (NUDIX family)